MRDTTNVATAHDVADELSDTLDNALEAARAYRDRCRSIVGLGQVRDGDKAYLSERRAKLETYLHDAANALYLLD